MVLLFKVLVVDLLHAEATILGSVCTNMQKMDNVHVIVWTTTCLVEIVLASFALYKMRVIKDDYGISTELKRVSFVWVVTAVGVLIGFILETAGYNFPFQLFRVSRIRTVHVCGGWWCVVQLLRDEGVTAFYEMQSWCIIIRWIALFGISVFWPVRQTYST
jgi:hypothetical protein